MREFLQICWFLSLPFVVMGCSGLFLYPDRHDYFPKIKDYVVVEEGFIPGADKDVQLHYWLIPAQSKKVLNKKPKGLIVQVHGNAQNLTSHVQGLGWITEAGYSLLIFDYRGYGRSTGKPSLDGAYKDVETFLDYIPAHLNPAGLPLIFYGQSLGGTLLLKAVSSHPGRWKPAMIVIESSFYSFTQIGREKMALSWITWPFQWMSYLVLSNRHGLVHEELATISPVPVWLFYSENDPIVPSHNGDRIYKELAEPKKLIKYPERGHIAAMWVQDGKFRKMLVEELDRLTDQKKNR